jgi:hypothetical protein
VKTVVFYLRFRNAYGRNLEIEEKGTLKAIEQQDKYENIAGLV